MKTFLLPHCTVQEGSCALYPIQNQILLQLLVSNHPLAYLFSSFFIFMENDCVYEIFCVHKFVTNAHKIQKYFCCVVQFVGTN